MEYGWESILENLNERKRENHIGVVKQKLGETCFSTNPSKQQQQVSSSLHLQKPYPMEHVQGKRAKQSVPNIEKQNSILKGSKNPMKVECNENVAVFWFSLVASKKQKSKVPLEQIPSRYLRVKDANITVSSIKKYLMQKLNLPSENEVEVSLEGRALLPSMQIWKLVDLWLHTAAASQRKTAVIGSSAHDFMLILTYARRPMSP